MRITVGSRQSRLAVRQAQIVMEELKRHHPEAEISLVTMKTTGDRILNRTLDQIGGKGLFIKELDLALQEGRIDLAVHSLKDMPMETPAYFPVLACTRREDPRDVLVLRRGLENLKEGSVIGCSSLRRKLQLGALYPEAQIKNIRGNVLTRLEKLDAGEYDALVLAASSALALRSASAVSSAQRKSSPRRGRASWLSRDGRRCGRWLPVQMTGRPPWRPRRSVPLSGSWRGAAPPRWRPTPGSVEIPAA